MASEAQTCAIGILANRRNPQNSTGPRTLSMSLGLATAKRFARTGTPPDSFMQNKPNLLNAQMNVNTVITMNYEQITMNNANKNKPNSNPIKPNFKPSFLSSAFCLLPRPSPSTKSD